jgi:hypothetical protein
MLLDPPWATGAESGLGLGPAGAAAFIDASAQAPAGMQWCFGPEVDGRRLESTVARAWLCQLRPKSSMRSSTTSCTAFYYGCDEFDDRVADLLEQR